MHKSISQLACWDNATELRSESLVSVVAGSSIFLVPILFLYRTVKQAPAIISHPQSDFWYIKCFIIKNLQSPMQRATHMKPKGDGLADRTDFLLSVMATTAADNCDV